MLRAPTPTAGKCSLDSVLLQQLSVSRPDLSWPLKLSWLGRTFHPSPGRGALKIGDRFKVSGKPGLPKARGRCRVSGGNAEALLSTDRFIDQLKTTTPPPLPPPRCQRRVGPNEDFFSLRLNPGRSDKAVGSTLGENRRPRGPQSSQELQPVILAYIKSTCLPT